MNERAITFGDSRHLVGILTEPNPERAAPDKPGVIFLNSGILHRVGASRVYVKMARRLASAGYPAFRFDHSGIGDSDVRRDERSFLESGIHEARQAMDLLEERRSVRRFVLAGLCSGSDMAYWVAQEDARVDGLIQLDPFVYRTRKAVMRHYLPRLVSPAAWKRSLTARTRDLVQRLKGRGSSEDDEAASVWVAPEYTRIFPPREETAEALGRLRERGVGFYVFISGDMGDVVNYPDQYAESFPEAGFGSELCVAFAPDADHTVTGLEHQEKVATEVVAWMQERYEDSEPVSGGEPEAALASPLHPVG